MLKETNRKETIRGLKEGATIKFDELVSISEDKRVSYVGKFIGLEEVKVGATKSTKVYLKLLGYNNINSVVKLYKIDVLRLYNISPSRLVGDKGREVTERYSQYKGAMKSITLKDFMYNYFKDNFKGALENVSEDKGEVVITINSKDLNRGLKYAPEILYEDDSAKYNIPKGISYTDISLLNMKAILGYEPVNFNNEDLRGIGECITEVVLVPVDTKGDYYFEISYRFKFKGLKVGNKIEEITNIGQEIVRIIKTNDTRGRKSKYAELYKKYMDNFKK